MKYKIIKKALPEGKCDICGRDVKNLDLYQDERIFACQICSRQVKEGEIILKRGEEKTVFDIEGYECLEKPIKSQGNSGRVLVPVSWVGGTARIVLTEIPREFIDGDLGRP